MLKQIVSAVLAENQNFRIVSVSFNNTDTRTYDYFSMIEGLEVDDLVVVNGAGQAKVAIVKAVQTFDEVDIKENIDYKWLIQKVDMTTHNACVDVQKKIVSAVRQKQRAQARQSLIGDLGDDVVKLVRI